MQTFLAHPEMKRNAEILDRSRLGKQRLETVQIARVLLGMSDSWSSHPAVKMWKGYEPFLIKVYLKSIIEEWERRGYRNEASRRNYEHLVEYVKDIEVIVPHWFCEKLFLSHQSNLVRKKPEHYGKFFPNVPNDIPYFWPV